MLNLERGVHDTKLEKLRFEVASTTLQLLLFIYSFQFMSAFLHVARTGFPSFTFTFSQKKEHILHTLTLNFDLDDPDLQA